MLRLYVQLVHSSATHLSKLPRHMVLLTNTSCMQSADPGSCTPQCFGAVQARNLDEKDHSIFSSKISQICGFVWWKLSTRYVCLFCWWNIKNCLVKSKTMFFMYTCIFAIVKYSQILKMFHLYLVNASGEQNKESVHPSVCFLLELGLKSLSICHTSYTFQYGLAEMINFMVSLTQICLFWCTRYVCITLWRTHHIQLPIILKYHKYHG